jgi:hypothetical protein
MHTHLRSPSLSHTTEDMTYLIDLYEQEIKDINFALYRGYAVMMPSREMDEVYPRVFVSEADGVKKIYKLKQLGITHVVNCAHGDSPYHVNTGAEFYGDEFRYHGIAADDCPEFNLMEHFAAARDFIDEALKGSTEGKVIINCKVGASRSAAVAASYLVYSGMSAKDALLTMIKRREICPNKGFVAQLIHLEKQLEGASVDKGGGGNDAK